jgi:hypothetical protein
VKNPKGKAPVTAGTARKSAPGGESPTRFKAREGKTKAFEKSVSGSLTKGETRRFHPGKSGPRPFGGFSKFRAGGDRAADSRQISKFLKKISRNKDYFRENK